MNPITLWNKIYYYFNDYYSVVGYCCIKHSSLNLHIKHFNSYKNIPPLEDIYNVWEDNKIVVRKKNYGKIIQSPITFFETNNLDKYIPERINSSIRNICYVEVKYNNNRKIEKIYIDKIYFQDYQLLYIHGLPKNTIITIKFYKDSECTSCIHNGWTFTL